MRRTLLFAGCCLTVAACQSENELRHTATLQAETSGVALSDDGLDGFAAMSGTTCTIDVNWGCPIADVDLPTVEDRVLDHWGDTTLGGSPDGVHQISGGTWNTDADLPMSDLRTARLSARGVATVHGDRTTCYHRLADGSDVAIPGAVCADDADVTVDRGTGTLYAATTEGVYAVTAAGAERLADAARHASWDPGTDHLLVVDADQRTLRALDRTGAEAWATRAGTDIHGMASRGGLGELLVLVDDRDGFGTVERRDASTGKVLGRSLLPTADGQLVVSANGARVALVRDDEVHFYALEVGVPPQELETEQPDCIVPAREGAGPVLD